MQMQPQKQWKIIHIRVLKKLLLNQRNWNLSPTEIIKPAAYMLHSPKYLTFCNSSSRVSTHCLWMQRMLATVVQKDSNESGLNKKNEQLESVERRRIECLPSDFSKIANENKFNVQKNRTRKKIYKTGPDLQSCLAFKQTIHSQWSL